MKVTINSYFLYLILTILLLSSCSNLSTLEKEIVGTWYWQESRDQFEEKGFVKLNENRTNSYELIAVNQTEKIAIIKQEEDGNWFLNQENSICIATEWSASSFFSKAKAEDSVCYWYIREVSSGNIQLILKHNGVLKNEIVAVRK